MLLPLLLPAPAALSCACRPKHTLLPPWCPPDAAAAGVARHGNILPASERRLLTCFPLRLHLLTQSTPTSSSSAAADGQRHISRRGRRCGSCRPPAWQPSTAHVGAAAQPGMLRPTRWRQRGALPMPPPRREHWLASQLAGGACKCVERACWAAAPGATWLPSGIEMSSGAHTQPPPLLPPSLPLDAGAVQRRWHATPGPGWMLHAPAGGRLGRARHGALW